MYSTFLREVSSLSWWEYQLIVGAQLERFETRRWGVSDLSCICGWADITKRDVSGWWGITGKGTKKKMVLESLPESGKSGNGWKMTWEFIPNTRVRARKVGECVKLWHTWRSLVCNLNWQCPGICGEAPYQGRRLTLGNRGGNRHFRNTWWLWRWCLILFNRWC